MFALNEIRSYYEISSRKSECLQHYIALGKTSYILSYGNATRVCSFANEEVSCHIVGLCIDSHSEWNTDDIPKILVNITDKDINEVFRWSCRLAGRFLILYTVSGTLYVIGDAQCSLSFYYSYLDGQFCAASLDYQVARIKRAGTDCLGGRIRRGALNNQGMPYDLTPYEGVYALLPNHIYDDSTHCQKRMSQIIQEIISKNADMAFSDLIKTTADRLLSITDLYYKTNNPIISLSMGWDSRLISSFCVRAAHNVRAFTYRHNHDDDSCNLSVPMRICSALGIHHEILDDTKSDAGDIECVARFAGNLIHPDQVSYALAIREKFGKCSILSGELWGHIGKVGMFGRIEGRDVTGYLLYCKQHNVNPECLAIENKYLAAIKEQGLKTNAADLYALEIRCGRWGSISRDVYSIIGIENLNNSNCREIIYAWMSIEVKTRVKKDLHRAYFNYLDTWSVFKDIPFNGSVNRPHLIDAKNVKWLYYGASVTKHFVEIATHFKEYRKYTSNPPSGKLLT